jgi:Tfp pilus assembly protein PilO
MNLITPIALLIVSGALFFAWINPIYQGNHTDANGKTDNIITLQSDIASYGETVANQTNLKNKIDSLSQIKSSLSDSDAARIMKMLPVSVDNVRLIVEIEDIVKKYNKAGFKGISVSKVDTKNATGASIVAGAPQYNTLGINFVVTMAYSDFVNFLRDLEDNLRIVDITNVSFTANDLGSYDFTVSLNTYWLNSGSN